ncbi:MAG: helix-turn-helix domain-containing protein [Candidatus Aminicenantes bacterium]|nr:helix-turn-helix domain-containing protein [Candidatus Aminicenantes bacterium]
MTTQKRLMTVKELADYLRIHDQTVYQLIYQRRIPFIKKKGLGYRFKPEEIKKWLEEDEHDVNEFATGHISR